MSDDPKWHAVVRALASVAFALIAVAGAFIFQDAGCLLIVFAVAVFGTILFGSQLIVEWWKGGAKMAFLKPGDELPEGLVPPGAADNMMRQVLQMCWMDLPKGNRSIDALEAEVNRLLERAFANLREDEKRKHG